jgi:hypothetical protein
MNINKENYEAYFLDYIEGNLDDNVIAALEEFLNSNPQLRLLLGEFEFVSLQPKTITFPDKNKIYKHEFAKMEITDVNFGDFCIAYLEGLLPDDKRNEFDLLLKKDPLLQKEVNVYKKVYVKPDNNIVFPNRRILYKGKTISVYDNTRKFIVWASIAASIVLGIFLFYPKNNHPSIELAQSTKKMPSLKVPLPGNISNKPLKSDILAKNTQIEKGKVILKSRASNNSGIKIKTVDSSLNLIRPIQSEPLIVSNTDVSQDYITLLSEDNSRVDFNNAPDDSIMDALEGIENSKMGLLALAENGVNGLNRLTGGNIELSHKTDDQGRINTFRLNTRLFGFYRKRSGIK